MMKRGMWSVYLWTKPRDKTISNFIVKNRFKIVTKPPFNFKREPGKFAIKAEAKSLKDLRAAQEGLFANAMDATWMTGKLALVLDELRYLTQILGLQDAVSVLFLQARSSSITLIAGSQRPRWIPIEAMSESKHFFIGPLLDKKDRQRLAEVLPLSTILLTEHLLENEFVYANMSGMAVIVKAR
jgi:hypothetical protein